MKSFLFLTDNIANFYLFRFRFAMNSINRLNINFGRKILYSAKLKQPLTIIPMEIEKEVYISELEPCDLEDMQKIKKDWTNTKYGERIINNFDYTINEKRFFDPLLYKKYYIVEDKKRKVRAMAFSEIMDDFVQLSLIQSEREKKGDASIKGAGSCLLYATSNLAQSLNVDSVFIRALPEAVQFYEKSGAEKIRDNADDYIVRKANFADFQSNLAAKYIIQPYEKKN